MVLRSLNLQYERNRASRFFNFSTKLWKKSRFFDIFFDFFLVLPPNQAFLEPAFKRTLRTLCDHPDNIFSALEITKKVYRALQVEIVSIFPSKIAY